MKFALLIAVVGISLISAQILTDPNALTAQVLQLVDSNDQLQQKVNDLNIKLADLRYKKQLIENLKIMKEILLNKCNSVENVGSSNNGLTHPLGYKVEQLTLTVDSTKTLLQTTKYTLANFLDQLKMKCDKYSGTPFAFESVSGNSGNNGTNIFTVNFGINGFDKFSGLGEMNTYPQQN